MHPTILHIELCHFFTAAAEQCYPHLRGRPFVVAPLDSGARVFAASPAAQKMGVSRGMFLRDARRVDRTLVVHPVDFKLYSAFNTALVKTVAAFSPVFEVWRQGNAYLEVLHRRQPLEQARDAAFRLQKAVAKQLELNAAIGVGANKLISRAASCRGVRRREIVWVPYGREAPFIAPFRVTLLPHVDRKIARDLENINIWRVSGVRAFPEAALQELFGMDGRWIYREARGIDTTPVMPRRKRFALHEEWQFVPETNDFATLRSAGSLLLNRLARQLRGRQALATRLTLSGTYCDGRFFTNGRTIRNGGDTEEGLFAVLLPLLEKMAAGRVALQRLGLSLSRLVPAVQGDLFAPTVPPKQKRLTAALDAIQARFGERAILWGRQFAAAAPKGAQIHS